MTCNFPDPDLSTPSMGQGWGQEKVWSQQPTETPLRTRRLRISLAAASKLGHTCQGGEGDKTASQGREENMKMPVCLYFLSHLSRRFHLGRCVFPVIPGHGLGEEVGTCR